MKIEKGRISSTQLMFLIIGLLEGSTLTAASIGEVTKKSTWLVLLLSLGISLPLILVCTSLSEKFPCKNLIEINDVIYGRYFGKIMSILYIFYFWLIILANLRLVADFFSIYLFPETHISVFIILITTLCLYTIRKGIEVIVNTGFVLTVLTIIIGVFISVVTVGEINLSNFLPLFQINLKDFVQGINLMVAIPFGDTVVFLMFYPYVNEIKQVKKSALWGLILGGMYFLSVGFRNLAILGELAFIHGFPSYQIAALINIGEFISRMEALIAVIMLFNLFLKICIFYYATALSAAQFLKLRSYKPLVSLIGIISIVLSLSVVSSPERESYILTNIYPIYAIPFVILFPIISLTIAFIKEKIA